MSTLLSFRLWLIFLHRLLKALYPADIVLFVFAVPSFKDLVKSRAMRFLFIFLICNLGVRMVPFFAGVPFSGRYFFPLAVNVAIFAACGIIPLVHLLCSKIFKSKDELLKFRIYCLLIIIIALSYSAKALMPLNDKPWLQMIPAAVRQMTPAGKTPVIITNEHDERFGYYAETSEYYQILPDKNWSLMKKTPDRGTFRWTTVNKNGGIASLAAEINKIGNDRVFIIFKVEKSGHSASDTELRENFPGIKQVGKFTDRKKRIFYLYKIDNSDARI